MSGAPVRARPAVLAAFANRTREADLEVGERVEQARAAAGRYLAGSGDGFAHDPGELLTAVDELLEERLGTARQVGDLARAFAAIDRDGWAAVEGHEGELDERLREVGAPPEELFAELLPHDDDRWHELLTGVPGARCEGRGTGHYTGGGFLRGPDGQLYPLVIPHVAGSDGAHNAAGVQRSWEEVESLGGAENGWVDVARRTGTTRVAPDPGVTGGLAAAAVATNAEISPTSTPIPRAAVDALGFGARGLTGGPPTPPPTSPPAAPAPPLSPGPFDSRMAPAPSPGAIDARSTPRTPPPPTVGPPAMEGAGSRPDGPGGWGGTTSGRGLRRMQANEARRTVPTAGVDALITVGEGVALARSMRDHGLAHADVRYQQTADGRRRAIARTVTGRTGTGGTVLSPAYVTADEDGALWQEPMRAEPHPTLGEEDAVRVDWGQGGLRPGGG